MPVTLDILEVGARGDGVAEENGQRYFVPFTLPGETVEAEPLGKRGEGITAELISLFCSFLAASFFFVGALFVSNAAFNNLGRPLYSMGFNWARATLGTIPFAYIGSHYGAIGVLIGSSIGAVIFGSLATWVAFRLTARQ